MDIATLEEMFALFLEKEVYGSSMEKEIEEALTDLPKAPTVLRKLIVRRIQKVRDSFID